MRCNVGKCERFLRVILGLGLMMIGSVANDAWSVAGLYFLITGLIGWCAVSRLFRVSTCRESEEILPDTSQDQGCENPLCGDGFRTSDSPRQKDLK